MSIASLWLQLPRPTAHKCTDTIEHVSLRLVTASCDPNQSIGYLQDYSGERYVLCRCHGVDDGYDVPELPKILPLLSPEADDDDDSPKTVERNDVTL